MNSQDFTNFVSSWGLQSGAGAVCLYFIYHFMKGDGLKYLNKILNYILPIVFKKTEEKKTNIKQISESDILNHNIFNHIDFWKYSRIPTFQFSTEYRTLVFRKYLFIFLKNWKENLVLYVKNKEFEQMDSSEIWKSFLSLINDVVYDYESECLSENIPKIVIEKMKSKNNEIISLTINLMEGICNSQFYESDKNFLKVYSILNIILSILENTIYNSENICNSINGQLRGQKFSDGGKVVQEP